MDYYYSKEREGAYTRKVWEEISPEYWDKLSEGQRNILIKKGGGVRLVRFVRTERDV